MHACDAVTQVAPIGVRGGCLETLEAAMPLRWSIVSHSCMGIAIAMEHPERSAHHPALAMKQHRPPMHARWPVMLRAESLRAQGTVSTAWFSMSKLKPAFEPAPLLSQVVQVAPWSRLNL